MEKIGDILSVLQRAYSLGMADKNIYELMGISPGTWSRAKNGTEPLHGQDWLNCKNLVLDCEELQRRCVAPISWSNLRAIRAQLESLCEERENPPSPPTNRDWQLLRLVHSMTPVAIAQQFGIALTELSKQFEDAQTRFDYATNQLAARNADIGRLSTETVALLDASQAKRNQQQ
jgi:hypothetical protein